MATETGQSQQQQQQQMSPLACLFQDVMFDVVEFLPPRDLAVLKMVCQFFSQNYSKWDMCISELSAKRRMPNNMCRAAHQTYCEALCYEKTFEGEAQKGYYHFSVFPVSTIALSFSCDRQHFASSHGDHSVKIIDFASGRIKQQLVGHPRTPWSVKFHPTKPNIVASGCLGSHVFLWDTNTGSRLTGVRVDSHVLSLAFHPEGNIIAIACTDFLHLWDYTKPLDPANPTETLSVCTHLRPAQAVRCVIFHPNGRQVIIGEVPPAMHRTETVKLQLWEYDKSKTLSERIRSPKTLCQTAQLYSDGGIDVSSCGNFLVTLSKRPGTSANQLSVVVMSLEPQHLGEIQIQLMLDPRAAKHVTSVKISPSKQFILLGASSVGDDKFTAHNPVVRIFKVNWRTRSIRVVYEDWGNNPRFKAIPNALSVYGGGSSRSKDRLTPDQRKLRRLAQKNGEKAVPAAAVPAAAAAAGASNEGAAGLFLGNCGGIADDDSNMCLFHPVEGKGLIFGTKQGNIKWLRFC